MDDRDNRRLLVANFDCEETWSDTGHSQPRTPSKHIKSLFAALAEHLRVFSCESTTLLFPWSIPRASEYDNVLAWGQTEQVDGFRKNDGHKNEPEEWQEALWHLSPSVEVAKTVNHKEFSFHLAQQNDWHHEGQRFVTSTEELSNHLSDHKNLGPGRWLIKAPYSAAGRHGVVSKTGTFSEEQWIHISRLLNRYSTVMIMPWLNRVFDFTVSGVIGRQQDWIFPPHFPLVDNQGVVRTIEINDSKAKDVFSASERTTLNQVTVRVVERLKELNYLGPFSVDGFVYQQEGKRLMHSLSEINGRLTFGLVARAHAERHNKSPYCLHL